MKKAVIPVIIICIAMFTSCHGIKTTPSEPLETTAPADNFEIAAHNTTPGVNRSAADKKSAAPPIYTFEGKIHDSWPQFTFEVFETDWEEPEHYEFYKATQFRIDISCPEIPDYNTQSLFVFFYGGWETDYMEYYIGLGDIDFDGYADLSVRDNISLKNNARHFYRYNLFDGSDYGSYDNEPFVFFTNYIFSSPERKQVRTHISGTADTHTCELYELRNAKSGAGGNFELVRSESVDYAYDKYRNHLYDEDGELLYDCRVVKGDIHDNTAEEIYSVTLTIDERWDDDIWQRLIYSYLDYGVAEPISLDDAVQMLYAEYGKYDEEGHELRFTFVEMNEYDGKPCYIFRLERNMESYFAMIGFYSVNTDGSAIRACSH